MASSFHSLNKKIGKFYILNNLCIDFKYIVVYKSDFLGYFVCGFFYIIYYL